MPSDAGTVSGLLTVRPPEFSPRMSTVVYRIRIYLNFVIVTDYFFLAIPLLFSA